MLRTPKGNLEENRVTFPNYLAFERQARKCKSKIDNTDTCSGTGIIRRENMQFIIIYEMSLITF